MQVKACKYHVFSFTDNDDAFRHRSVLSNIETFQTQHIFQRGKVIQIVLYVHVETQRHIEKPYRLQACSLQTLISDPSVERDKQKYVTPRTNALLLFFLIMFWHQNQINKILKNTIKKPNDKQNFTTNYMHYMYSILKHKLQSKIQNIARKNVLTPSNSQNVLIMFLDLH